jgi:hypothetical protein
MWAGRLAERLRAAPCPAQIDNTATGVVPQEAVRDAAVGGVLGLRTLGLQELNPLEQLCDEAQRLVEVGVVIRRVGTFVPSTQ